MMSIAMMSMRARRLHFIIALWLCGVPLASAADPQFATQDRLGALNHMTPKQVLKAMRLVKTGKVYSLAIPLAPSDGKYSVKIEEFDLEKPNQVTGFSDRIELSPTAGTSMDGLGHAGRNHRHFGGVNASDIAGPRGARIYGIETLPPFVTRGVLLDVARHRKIAVVPNGTAINGAELRAIARAEGVTIREGDVVLLHTGWLDQTLKDPDASKSEEPGLGREGARYLAELGVVAVGADTVGVEVNPAETPGEYAPIHQILLADNGIYLFESVNTSELAADKAYEFLFMAAPPRLTGSVQANLHPIAIR
jgi:kynurenine formamidase